MVTQPSMITSSAIRLFTSKSRFTLANSVFGFSAINLVKERSAIQIPTAASPF
ncbi:hypothetical protein CY34DRAFT_812184 [Suillus luteus UH-Slu-Lm8-n1]|uniref:Uncharacterized protein n=1 Tax=Suillus luteus UH-Slu-Lm8-n1 TaxID=930992 RepID=A0A0D0AMJ3_9AGAM|nr:hypothetical protein CY34DRAFT_812184 [Suillus luteus UH-Slu-Lm8-n1]